jgi:hypothetical protein
MDSSRAQENEFNFWQAAAAECRVTDAAIENGVDRRLRLALDL